MREAQARSKLQAVMLAFVPVNDYTNFRAEFAIDAGDIVFHFYRTPEVEKLHDVRKYWAETFPAVLEPVAKAHFNTDFPRIKAQHVFDDEQPYSKAEPLDSWWFRAYGFGHLLDPHALARKFIELLDAGLDAALKANRT